MFSQRVIEFFFINLRPFLSREPFIALVHHGSTLVTAPCIHPCMCGKSSFSTNWDKTVATGPVAQLLTASHDLLSTNNNTQKNREESSKEDRSSKYSELIIPNNPVLIAIFGVLFVYWSVIEKLDSCSRSNSGSRIPFSRALDSFIQQASVWDSFWSLTVIRTLRTRMDSL